MYVCICTHEHMCVCVCFEKAHTYRDIWAALVNYSLIMVKSRGVEKKEDQCLALSFGL